jgi:hypothetical protein
LRLILAYLSFPRVSLGLLRQSCAGFALSRQVRIPKPSPSMGEGMGGGDARARAAHVAEITPSLPSPIKGEE